MWRLPLIALLVKWFIEPTNSASTHITFFQRPVTDQQRAEQLEDDFFAGIFAVSAGFAWNHLMRRSIKL
jgi:hypothetical protein